MSLLLAAQGLGQWANNRGLGIMLEALGSRDADFLAKSAQRSFELRNYAAAEAVARRAVEGAPLHQKALRIVGMAQVAQGNPQGHETVRAAGLLGWQDVPTQAWLMIDALQRGQPQEAIFRADALARRAGVRPELLPLIVAFADDSTTLPTLLDRLELAPTWRRDFFRMASEATATQTNTRDMLLRRLQRGDAPPTREEVTPVVRRLVVLGDYDRADALATDLLGKPRSGSGNLVDDGGFALADVYRRPNNERTPFDWEIGSTRGATATVGASAGQDDGALYVDSNGAQPAVLATKVVRVPPGSYRFAFTVVSPDANALERFNWSATCLPGTQALLEETSAALVAGQARRVELPLTVPSSGCEAQTLRLHAKSTSPRETVGARFDDIEIRPLP